MYHRRKHGSSRPNIQRIVIVVVVNQQLWSFEVAGSHSDVVVLTHVIKLCQAPIDELQNLFVVVHDYVLWLNIPMHDASAVTEVKSLR